MFRFPIKILLGKDIQPMILIQISKKIIIWELKKNMNQIILKYKKFRKMNTCSNKIQGKKLRYHRKFKALILK